jgi:hypothetical protein
MCRVAFASTVDRGWHSTEAMGAFGAPAGRRQAVALDAGTKLPLLIRKHHPSLW